MLLILLLTSLGVGSAPAIANGRVGALKAMWGPSFRGQENLFPIYQALGVKIYEDRLGWEQTAARQPKDPTNPNDPAYTWPAEVDAAVAEAKRYHIHVALQIIGAPMWANGGKPWNWAPRHPQDYANFAIAAARRYPSVHLWMIWGEPSRRADFEPLTPAPRSGQLNAHQSLAPRIYAGILDSAYEALKHVSRSNMVIGGMTYSTGEISPGEWIEHMRLPNGRPPRLDMYGHNPFSYHAPNLANPPIGENDIEFSDLARLARIVDRNLGRPGNPRPKLFISEWTVPTADDQEFNFWVEQPVQAQWITDGLKIGEQLSSIYAIGWVHLYDEPPLTYGGLIETDGAEKPGYYAWKDG